MKLVKIGGITGKFKSAAKKFREGVGDWATIARIKMTYRLVVSRHLLGMLPEYSAFTSRGVVAKNVLDVARELIPRRAKGKLKALLSTRHGANAVLHAALDLLGIEVGGKEGKEAIARILKAADTATANTSRENAILLALQKYVEDRLGPGEARFFMAKLKALTQLSIVEKGDTVAYLGPSKLVVYRPDAPEGKQLGPADLDALKNYGVDFSDSYYNFKLGQIYAAALRDGKTLGEVRAKFKEYFHKALREDPVFASLHRRKLADELMRVYQHGSIASALHEAFLKMPVYLVAVVSRIIREVMLLIPIMGRLAGAHAELAAAVSEVGRTISDKVESTSRMWNPTRTMNSIIEREYLREAAKRGEQPQHPAQRMPEGQLGAGQPSRVA